MKAINALIDLGVRPEVKEVKAIAQEAAKEFAQWQYSKGVVKEQHIRAGIRTYNQQLLSMLNDPENKASDLKTRFRVWGLYNMTVGLYAAIRLEPAPNILKAIQEWELKSEGLEVYHDAA